jgi:hypothetical protein
MSVTNGGKSELRGKGRTCSVTADTYTHVLLDDRELDHTACQPVRHSTRLSSGERTLTQSAIRYLEPPTE